MAKITFRASEDLVERLEAFEESKSEILREALRTYLDDRPATGGSERSLDELVAERVDELIADRTAPARREPRDVNVNITVDGEAIGATAEPAADRKTDSSDRETDAGRDGVDRSAAGATCGQCGQTLADGEVYCPNCGEKAARRVFCECGDELRSDWSFCPSCGRRTPAAEVLEGT